MNRKPLYQHHKSGDPVMLDDDILVAKARTKDQDAWENLWARYRRLLFRIALSILCCRSDAEDVLQEAFFNAFRYLHSFKGGSFKGWLCTIVRNESYALYKRNDGLAEVSYDELRPASRRSEQGKTLDELPAEEFIPDLRRLEQEKVVDRLTVEKIMQELKPRHQKVIGLWAIDKCTVAEIATQLQLTRHQVRSSIAAFRMALPGGAPAKAKKQSA
jgi:RNA polymerase sigma-70 factor, ECF subfamily